MRFRLSVLLILTLGLATSAVSAPKPGLLSVIGSAVPGVSHADRGAPAPMQGLALKYSGAELGYCNIMSSNALDPLIASGCEIAVYVDRYTSSGTGAWLYDKGVRYFIFENEPDGTLADYASVLPLAYPVVHSLGPLAKMVSGNCFGSGAYSYLYQNGFKNCSDLVGFHNYSDDPASGLDISSVVSVHNTMSAYGDGAKKIYLGEGWGPKRELRTCPRISPDIPPSIQEIQQLKDFVVNGWRNLTTAAGSYTPNWVYGALFFTLSDNWGFDYAHFYNGGLVDLDGNPKDDLLLLFPGDKPTVANCGFEYCSPGRPSGAAPFWQSRSGTAESCYALDGSIRKSGQRSQRIELSGTTEAYVSQTTYPGSVTAGQQYCFAAWIRTQALAAGAYPGARLRMRFYNASGSTVGGDTWSAALQETSDWSYLMVAATAPSGAVKVRIECNVQGNSGCAWFDDCGLSIAAAPQTGSIEGYVFDMSNNALADAKVALQPDGASATTDSTGNFYISGLAAGAYEVTAVKPGYGAKTVSRIAVAPGRTSIAGLNLQTTSTNSPSNVRVTTMGVSEVLRVSWEQPPTGADFYRVYRSTSPGSLGARVFDNVTTLTVFDEGLSDYQTYYYTVRRVLGGAESANSDRHSGIPVGGATIVTYDINASPNWSNWSSSHGQTFVANKTGGIVSTTCVLATAGEPRARNMTFSIREGGPTGPQIGPSRTVTCYSDEIGTANWSGSEVPVVEGHTYYLMLQASSATAIYRSNSDVYTGGRYYKDGQPYSPSSDLWSTITIAEATSPDILNVAAANVGPGMVRVTWETTAPATSQVHYGLTPAYGSSSPADPTMTAEHRVVLTELAAGEYHFRTSGARAGGPNAYSLNYTFTIPQGAGSIREAKSQPDGTALGFNAVVSALFGSHMYVQDSDRISGVRVNSAGQGLTQGMAVYVTGILRTTPEGERYIDAATIAPAE